MDERQLLLRSLKGQKIVIEGLRSASAHWPSASHPQIDLLRQDVDLRLRSLFPTHPKLQRLLKGDYGMFGATWWPCANLRTARVATYLSIWLFMWDDEVDSDIGTLAKDFNSAQAFRLETLEYVKSGLGLASSKEFSEESTHSDEVIRSFDSIASEMRILLSEEQRKCFFTELGFFLEKSEVEQRLRLSNRVPTFEQFWDYRLGTSAVRVVLAVNQLCNETDLPGEVMSDANMMRLWNLTNAIICMTNDLLSVKKELTEGSVESLIPILYNQTGSAQTAVNSVLDMLRQQIAEFDSTASALLSAHQADPAVREALLSFVDGCKFYCTGNLTWRYFFLLAVIMFREKLLAILL